MSALCLHEISDQNTDYQRSLKPFTEGDDECAEHGESVIDPGYLRNSYVA
jgi:hypothetical protein